MPLEANYRVTLTADQVAYWCSHLSSWSNDALLQTLDYVLGDCARFPTLADFLRLRPAPREDYKLPPPAAAGGLGMQFESAGRFLKPGTWPHLVWTETVAGLKNKDMPAAYERVIDAAKSQGIDPTPFGQARDQCVSLKAARKEAARMSQVRRRKRERRQAAAVTNRPNPNTLA